MSDTYLFPALVPLSLIAVFAGVADLWFFAGAVALNVAEIIILLWRS